MPQALSLRSLTVASAVQRYRIPAASIRRGLLRLLREGVPASSLLVDESAPDDQVLLQAEVMLSPRCLEMRYATGSGVGMRQAYLSMRHTHGAVAVAILRHYLDPASQDCLFDNLALYSDSVCELSSYPFGLGVLGWNTLFWEWRNY